MSIQMLKTLAWSGYVEINNLNSVVKYKDSIWKRNIYFCAGMDSKTERCKDSDFTKKKYFVVDIDLRENFYQETWDILSQEQMELDIKIILELLNESWLWDYSYVVMSGNWVHIYYVWNEIKIDPRAYSSWVKYMYELIDEIIEPMWYHCDQACSNISRITRLPWSINPRKKEKSWKVRRDLGDIECLLIVDEVKESLNFNMIKSYSELYNDLKEKSRQIVSKKYSNDDNIFDEINDISCLDIACDLYWVDKWASRDWVVTLKESHKNMGAYYYEPKNLIINTWSSLIKNSKEDYFTTWRLVKDEMFNWDTKRALEYFKDKHWVEVKKKGIIPEKKDYSMIWYVYPWDAFNRFECLTSGELCIMVAKANSWKTTFAMNTLLANKAIGKKWCYINLEFDIETVAKERWLSMNGKGKRNLTDLDPLSEDELKSLQNYVKDYISKFDYVNAPWWLELDDLIDIIVEKNKEWIWLFVVDSFSKIKWTLVSDKARTVQNKSMEKLQELCQNIWVCIIVLHHTNKRWEHEWSQKILDLANVFITIERECDPYAESYTTFTLTKDKFVEYSEIETTWKNWEYEEVSNGLYDSNIKNSNVEVAF